MLTTLTKRAMPMIRYRTGDITTLSTEPCACGRTSARIARIKGRADDMLIIKGVNLYPSEVEADAAGRGGAGSRTTCWWWTAAPRWRAWRCRWSPARRCWSVVAGSAPSIRRWASSIAA